MRGGRERGEKGLEEEVYGAGGKKEKNELTKGEDEG